MKKLFIHILFVSSLVFQAVALASTLEEKTQSIESVVVQAMETFEVPGAAIAIVKDGEVVFSKGFGVIEHGKNTPVTTETLFGVASNTKAMTAALLASLVDEGKLSWKTKVIDIIPEFQMPDPYVTREFTIVDLLAHNSGLGLGAGDLMIWPQTSLTNADIIRGLKYLPQVSSFRSEFAYDNLMYVIAGEVVAKVTGKSWEENIQVRIFEPLGMDTTRAKYSLIEKSNKNVARAHVPLNGELNVVGGNFLEQFSSAGSVASNVEDMSKWIKLQLNKGLVNKTQDQEQRIFSEAQSQAMWQARTLLPVSESATKHNKTHFSAYGLGWFLNDYHGVKLVHHSGGILGMVSKVALVPEENLGMVILTNQQSGYAFNALYHHTLNQFLGLPAKDWIAHYSELKDNRAKKEKERLAENQSKVDKNAAHSLPLRGYAQTYQDDWYGDIIVHFKNNKLHMQFGNTEALKGTLEHYQHNTFIVRWQDRTLEADAFVNFNLNEEGIVSYATMKAVSHATDFSFDFHDLKLKPKSNN